jgi:hypothetical protein
VWDDVPDVLAEPAPPAATPHLPAAPAETVAEPRVVIEQVSIVTEAAPAAADPFASLAGRRRAASRHAGSR